MSDLYLARTGYSTAITLIGGTPLQNLTSTSWATGHGAGLLDTGANGWVLADIVLEGDTNVTAGSGDPRGELYLLPVPDGTNLPDPPGSSAALTPPGFLVGLFRPNPSATFRRLVMRDVELPPGKFYCNFRSVFGANLPNNTNSSIKAYPHTLRSRA